MTRRQRGFTIIELMIVITVIVIIALLAVPSLIAGKLVANEVAALSALRSVTTAQQQFRQSAKADEDTDGTGEYGGLGELGGVLGVRGGVAKVPTDLTRSMGQLTPAGEAMRSGYVFRMYLARSDGSGIREPAGGFTAGVVDPDLSETTWVCYAWPVRYGITGNRTFVVNQQGDIHFTDTPNSNGANCATITAGAAFLVIDPSVMTGRIATGATGADGNTWRTAQ